MFNPDKKPDGIPTDVWNARKAWEQCRGSHEERDALWDKAIEIRKRYTVIDGKWILNDVQGNLF